MDAAEVIGSYLRWRMDEPADWLAADEIESARWTAAVPTLGGRGAKYGGRLHLTSRRLVWVPLRIHSAIVADGVFAPIDVGGDWWELALADTDHIEPDPKRGALVHIVARDGTRKSLLIAAGRLTPVWSKKNRLTRDEAVERITASLRGA